MANTSSAKKAIRKSERRRMRNEKKESELLGLVRTMQKLLATGKKSDAENLLSKAYKLYDKSVKTGLLKKNTAARKKSKLAKLFKK